MIIPSLVILMLLLVMGWIVGEVRNDRQVRVICASLLVLAIIATGCAAAVSIMLSSARSTLSITEAQQRWAQAMQRAMQADRLDRARQEVDWIAATAPAYEPITHIKMLDESAARLTDR